MISVIIPIYNSGNYIKKALDSVLVQDVEKEVILIDDFSTDGTREWLDEIFESHYVVSEKNHVGTEIETENLVCILEWQGTIKDTAVRYYKNNVNYGVAKTRNFGVEVAMGDYIAFLDADDWWSPDKLVRQIKMLNKTNAVLCNTAREFVNPDESPIGHIVDTPQKITLKEIEKTNCINCSAVLVKKEALLKYPMEHDDAHEDYLTWLKILKEYKYAVGINAPLLKYRLTIGGKSRNKFKSAYMTYKTYCYAGYNKFKSFIMMFPYTYNGLKKYKNINKNRL